MQRFFAPLTVWNKKTSYVAGEFGLALGAISIALGIYLWTRRDEVETSQPVVPAEALPSAHSRVSIWASSKLPCTPDGFQ